MDTRLDPLDLGLLAAAGLRSEPLLRRLERRPAPLLGRWPVSRPVGSPPGGAAPRAAAQLASARSASRPARAGPTTPCAPPGATCADLSHASPQTAPDHPDEVVPPRSVHPAWIGSEESIADVSLVATQRSQRLDQLVPRQRLDSAPRLTATVRRRNLCSVPVVDLLNNDRHSTGSWQPGAPRKHLNLLPDSHGEVSRRSRGRRKDLHLRRRGSAKPGSRCALRAARVSDRVPGLRERGLRVLFLRGAAGQ